MLKMKQTAQQQQQQVSSTAEKTGRVEEVIKAFIAYLVDPLLPLKIRAPPVLSNQQQVAKQMHAVVLLYNYYQRKRHAQAEYIDFTSFCKLVVTLKPVLAAYMTSMHVSTPTDSENLENQLSVAEKAIKDACKISVSLDVSRDIPDVNEWEVSKVAVFLVDSSKENCALSFNLLTCGVWSIFENIIDHCIDNEDKRKNKNKKKRKRRQATGEPDLQQLAFSALKEARGIQQSDLTILERHVTYSLDKERSSACCFIMECRSTNQKFEFPVRDAIESLQGPLVEKIYGNWTHTELIEYYNVLPYAGIVSSWFSRYNQHMDYDENTEGTSVADPTINPVESMHSARNNLLSVFALRETKSSEAALGDLVHKKNKLYHQLQDIEDEIALVINTFRKFQIVHFL